MLSTRSFSLNGNSNSRASFLPIAFASSSLNYANYMFFPSSFFSVIDSLKTLRQSEVISVPSSLNSYALNISRAFFYHAGYSFAIKIAQEVIFFSSAGAAAYPFLAGFFLAPPAFAFSKA